MRNYVQPGSTLNMVSPTGGVVSGQPVLIGGLFGIAAGSAAEGTSFELAVVGVFRVAKAAEAIDTGDKLYWDGGNGNLTKTPGVGLYPIGAAIAAAASGDPTVAARLDGVATAAL